MCVARKHVDYLQRSNEQEFRDGRVSYETFARFEEICGACQECPLCDNGEQGDILPDCRTAFLRVFISLKRDSEKWIREGRSRAGRPPGVAPRFDAAAPGEPPGKARG